MKTKGFFIMFIALCLFLTGCSISFNWDKSVSKLEDAGYVVVNAGSENLEDATKSINSDIKLDGGDFTVEVVKYASMVKDNDYDFQCILIQFASTDQATIGYGLTNVTFTDCYHTFSSNSNFGKVTGTYTSSKYGSTTYTGNMFWKAYNESTGKGSWIFSENYYPKLFWE